MKFERSCARWHLHLSERSKGVHALGVAGIDVFDSLLDFCAEGRIESLGVRLVVEGGDQMLMYGHHLFHRELSESTFEFFGGYAHTGILTRQPGRCQNSKGPGSQVVQVRSWTRIIIPIFAR